MNIGVMCFTRKGMELALRAAQALKEYESITVYTKWKEMPEDERVKVWEEDIYSWTRMQFQQHRGILFVGACGIAVRAVAPVLKDKLTDVPVLVMDEAGQFVIPILSGHYGGANELAAELALRLEMTAVITTATDVNRLFAVDVFARRNGLVIRNRDGIKKVSAAVLAGRRVTAIVDVRGCRIEGRLPQEIQLSRLEQEMAHDVSMCSNLLPDGNVETEMNSKLGGNVQAKVNSLPDGNAQSEVNSPSEENMARDAMVSEGGAAFLVSAFRHEDVNAALQLCPRNIYVGIGCRRGKTEEEIAQAVDKCLRQAGIWPESVAGIASVELKKDEAGLCRLAQRWGLPFLTFTARELEEVPGEFCASEFVKAHAGVDNVCERAALAACGAGTGAQLLVRKQAGNGITVAAAAREWRIVFDEE